jgi:hypothetical protein
MKFSVKTCVKPLLLAAMAATLAASPFAANAQMGGGMGGPGGGGGMGGGMRMRNSPKGRLGRLVRGIGMLEQEKKAPLTVPQARTIANSIKPWRTKKVMTDDQAKGLYMSINNTLTAKQKNEMDKDSAKNRRFGGERPGGGRGMGGPGGGNAPDPKRFAEMRAQMEKMRGLMKTMNPFYPPLGYPEIKTAPDRMREGMVKRYQRQNATLAAIAKKGGVKW